MDKSILKRLDEVIITDATLVSKVEFLATHLPFKKLKYTNSGENYHIISQYNEKDFFNKFISDNKDKHTFLVVEGKSGSGKSHFIKWMKYIYESEIDSNDEISIMIERSKNTLQGAIKQIVEHKDVRSLLNEIEIKKLLEANSNLSSEKLSYMINLAFATEILSEEDEECILKSRERKLLASFIQDPNVQEQLLFIENGPIERIKSKLKNENVNEVKEIDITFNERDFNCEFGSDLDRYISENAAKHTIKCHERLIENEKFKINAIAYLNSKLDTVIQSCIKLNSQDFSEIFLNIRRKLKLQGKKLTLFIEDLTSFTGIDKALVEILITEHGNDNGLCRILSVVGVTEAYYKSHFPSNIKSRITGRVIIDEESIFSKNEDVLDIVARYLNSIYIDRKKLEIWVENGASDSELPIANKYMEHEWSSYRMDNRIFTLFPFNDNALISLYKTLEDKTPRMLLKEIIKKVIHDYVNDSDNFPYSDKIFKGVFKVPVWNMPLHEQILHKEVQGENFERLSCFMRVWGNGTAYSNNENGKEFLSGVSKEAYEFFRLPFIKGVPIDSSKAPVNKPIEKKTENEDTKKVERTLKNNLDNRVKEKLSFTKTDKEQRSIPKPEMPKKIDQNREKYNKALETLNNWFNDKDVLMNHRTYREDICRLIKTTIDWDMEDISRLVIESTFVLGKFHIEGQTVRITEGYVLNRTKENYYLLQAICAWRNLGKKSWGFEEAAGYLENVTNWVMKNRDKLIEFINKQDISSEMNISSFELAIYNDFMMNVINRNISIEDKLPIIYSKIFRIQDRLNRRNVEKVGKISEGIMKGESDVNNNHEMCVRYHNCSLGTANPQITDKFFIDASEVLKVIKKHINVKWQLNSIDIKDIVASTSNMHRSYKLYKSLLGSSLNISIDSLIKDISDMNQKIKKLLEYSEDDSSKQNIEQVFSDFIHFLTVKMESINETYGMEFNKIVNKSIDGKYALNLLCNNENIINKSNLEKLDYIVKDNIAKTSEIYKLVLSMNRYVDEKYNKYSKSAQELDDVTNRKKKEEDKQDQYINELNEIIKEL